MKTFTVALLFVFSLLTLFASVRADALSQPRIEPRMARPAMLVEGDDDKGDDKDDERDEEEYRRLSQHAAPERIAS